MVETRLTPFGEGIPTVIRFEFPIKGIVIDPVNRVKLFYLRLTIVPPEKKLNGVIALIQRSFRARMRRKVIVTALFRRIRNASHIVAEFAQMMM